jgi:hypothetical protein
MVKFGNICLKIYFISWQLETPKLNGGFIWKIIYKSSINKGLSIATFDYQREGGYFSH